MSARGFRLSLALAVLASRAPALAQQGETSARTFTYGCETLALDLRNNRSVCSMVQISDGTIEISADTGTASETNFESSEWEFTGHVRIAFETATLSADSAVFRFAANALVMGELSGRPVELRDYIAEQDTTVTGTAEKIVYDNRDGTARMSGQARLTRGENEYLGCDMIVYNLNEKTLDLSGSPDCRVQLRILSREERSGTPDPAREPSP